MNRNEDNIKGGETMHHLSVRIYGLFGQHQGVELDLEEQIVETLKEEELLNYGDKCYEIKSLINTGSKRYINVRLIPNPQLYNSRSRRDLIAQVN